MKRVLIIGAGRVGSAAAADLASDPSISVTVGDIHGDVVRKLGEDLGVSTSTLDVRDTTKLEHAIRSADIVLSAVPGALGFTVARTVIAAGKDLVDVSFSPEDPFQLAELAKSSGSRAIVDCGVAPGLSHILVGYACSVLSNIDSVLIYVGGLPRDPLPPLQYKTVFSPADVLEEYVRPARYREHGTDLTTEALSDLELLDLPAIGTLEAFLTDGLRTLLHTVRASNMKEKTLRYPGHADKIRLLREIGLFKRNLITVKGVSVQPFDVAVELVSSSLRLELEEEDLTVMRVVVAGDGAGKKQRYCFDLFDVYDRDTRITSMARTTGFTATAAVRMLSVDIVKATSGIIPPERLGEDPACLLFLRHELAMRNIIIKESCIEIS